MPPKNIQELTAAAGIKGNGGWYRYPDIDIIRLDIDIISSYPRPQKGQERRYSSDATPDLTEP
jgi:hypothetical protein